MNSSSKLGFKFNFQFLIIEYNHTKLVKYKILQMLKMSLFDITMVRNLEDTN